MATVSGETPTTTSGVCSPAGHFPGAKQKAAIVPIAARLLRTGGIDIIILACEDGRGFVRLQAIAMEGLEGGFVTTLRHYASFFRFSC